MIVCFLICLPFYFYFLLNIWYCWLGSESRESLKYDKNLLKNLQVVWLGLEKDGSKWQPKSHGKPSKSGYILCCCSSKIQNFIYVHCINDRKIFSMFFLFVNTLCIRDSVPSALDSFGFIGKMLAKLFKNEMQIVIVQIEKEWLLAIYEISFVVSASLVSNIFMYFDGKHCIRYAP